MSEGAGHNNAAGEMLKSYIARIERIAAEKADLAEAIKEIYIEVKSAGLSVKVVRRIVRERAMDQQKRREEEETMEMYVAALGGLIDTPLGQAAVERVRG